MAKYIGRIIKTEVGEHLKRHWAIYALGVILLSAGFFRSWHLGEYSLFRADQARDAYYAKDIVDSGWGYFKLLGPKAGVTVVIGELQSSFKLGPMYNYLQYVAVGVSGQVSALTLVLVDWLLALGSIPLLYIFLRNFFSKGNSLGITTMYSFSYILILYSRFSWNINQIIFWELLFVVAILEMLKMVDLKKKKGAGYWLCTVVFAGVVVSQLHVLSAIAFGLIFIAILGIYRPVISWKYWIGAAMIGVFLYVPVIVSEIYNKGDNTKRFISASKAEKTAEGDIEKQISKVNKYHGKNYSLILTALNKYDNKSIDKKGSFFMWASVSIIVLMLLWTRHSKKGLLQGQVIKKLNKVLSIEDVRKRRFLWIVLLWFVFFLLVYFKILPRLHKTRYWLLIAPLPFIFLGMWFWLIERVVKNRYVTSTVIITSISIILFSNITAILIFYKALSDGVLTKSKYHQKITLGPYGFLTTYGEMRDISDYLAEKVSQSKQDNLCFKSLEYQNKLGFEFLLDLYHPELKYEQTSDGGNYKCAFYVITRTTREDRELEDFRENYNIGDRRTFKSLTVWELTVKNNIMKKQKIQKKQRGKFGDKRAIYWKDLSK